MERREIFLYVRSLFLWRRLKTFLAALLPESLRQLLEIRSVYSFCMSAITVGRCLAGSAELVLTGFIKPLMKVNKVLYVSLFWCFLPWRCATFVPRGCLGERPESKLLTEKGLWRVHSAGGLLFVWTLRIFFCAGCAGLRVLGHILFGGGGRV